MLDANVNEKPAAVRHSKTSVAAAERIAGGAGSLRRKVYDFLARCGELGATDEEMQDALGMNASTQRPRRCELVYAEYVADGGRTRPTRSGCAAVVWVLTEYAPKPQRVPFDPESNVYAI